MALFNALLPPSPRASTPRRRDQRALTTRKKKISLLRETSRFLIKGSRSIQQVVLFSTNVLLVHFIRIHPVLRISLLSFFLPFFFHVYLSSFNLTCVNVIKILHIYIYIYMVSTILYENRVATSLNEWTRSSENSHRITSGIQLTESRIG